MSMGAERNEPGGERQDPREALLVAADDLDKAANQFASMRESQKAGHNVQIESNPEKFAEKAARARRAASSVPVGGAPREKVAEALFHAESREDTSWADESAWSQEVYRKHADAAIAAMRGGNE